MSSRHQTGNHGLTKLRPLAYSGPTLLYRYFLMKTTTTLLTCLGLLIATSPANAAKFYKWTDAEGATHYSADPPPDSVKASEVRVKTKSSYEGEPAAPATPQKDATAPAATKDGKADAGKGEEKKAENGSAPGRYAEKCTKLKADLQTLQESPRVKVTDAKGESRTLSEEEKVTQIDETQRQIKAFCE